MKMSICAFVPFFPQFKPFAEWDLLTFITARKSPQLGHLPRKKDNTCGKKQKNKTQNTKSQSFYF